MARTPMQLLAEYLICKDRPLVDRRWMCTVRAAREGRCRSNRLLDLFSKLPVELRVECFVMLPLQGRIAASHVNERWREVLLDTPRIWRVTREEDRLRPRMLQVVLERSRSTRLQLASDQSVDGPALAIIANNVDRVEILRLKTCENNVFSLLAAQCAPALMHAEFPCSTFCAELPADWAPRLRSLTVGDIDIPDRYHSLPSVRELTCLTTRRTGITNRLFQVFPSLTALTLHGVRDGCLFPTTLPPTLHAVTLSNVGPSTYGEILRTWASTSRLKTLDISHAADIESAFSFFHSVARPKAWSLRVFWHFGADRSSSYLVIAVQVSSLSVIIRSPYLSAIAHTVFHCMKGLDLLESLEIPAYWLPAFSLTPLPLLTELTVSINDYRDLETLLSMGTYIRLPRLQRIYSVISQCTPYNFGYAYARLLQIVGATGQPRVTGGGDI